MIMLSLLMLLSGSLCADAITESPAQLREKILSEVRDNIKKIHLRDESEGGRFNTISDVVSYMADTDNAEMMLIFKQLIKALKPVQKYAEIDTDLSLMWNYCTTPGSFANDIASNYNLGVRLGKKMSSDEELLGVLLHEACHIKENDAATRQMIIYAVSGASAMAVTFARTAQSSVGRALLGGSLVILGLLARYYSSVAQAQEKRADLFAARLGFAKGLQSYLESIQQEYPESDISVVRWLKQLFLEHPEIGDRIEYLNEYHEEYDTEKEPAY